MPQSLVPQIIKIFHENRGHQGISRSVNMMKRLFWFRRMREQVNKHVNNCMIYCQHANHKAKYESKHLPIPQRLFDGICLDCVGPMERSSRGFKWVLTCINLHSLFLLAVEVSRQCYPCVYRVNSAQIRTIMLHLNGQWDRILK